VLCKKTLEENIVLKDMMVCLIEVITLVVKQEEVVLGFKPQRKHEEKR
jgi:hypothetical protein